MAFKTVGIIDVRSVGGSSLVRMFNRRPDCYLPPIKVLGNPSINMDYLFNRDIISRSDVGIVSVKPRQMRDICDSICSVSGKIPIISTAPFIPLNKLHLWLCENKVIIRCMPSISCEVGKGIVPYHSNYEKKYVHDLMSNLFAPNKVLRLSSDNEMNAATIINECDQAFFAWYVNQLEPIWTRNCSDEKINKMLIGKMTRVAAALKTYSTKEIIKMAAGLEELQIEF